MNGMVDSIYFFFLFVMINNINNNKCMGKGGLLYTYDAPNKPVLYCVCADLIHATFCWKKKKKFPLSLLSAAAGY